MGKTSFGKRSILYELSKIYMTQYCNSGSTQPYDNQHLLYLHVGYEPLDLKLYFILSVFEVVLLLKQKGQIFKNNCECNTKAVTLRLASLQSAMDIY